MINCYGVDCAGWVKRHERANIDMLGYLPDFISDHDVASAKAQFDKSYRFGGWRTYGINEWKMQAGDKLKYPGDPAFAPLYERKLRDERILMYQHAIVAIVQPDGSFEVARLD